jgi:hypothetical protein
MPTTRQAVAGGAVHGEISLDQILSCMVHAARFSGSLPAVGAVNLHDSYPKRGRFYPSFLDTRLVGVDALTFASLSC